MRTCGLAAGRAVRQGIAATELALLLPFMCLLFVIAVDFARVFYYDLTVANCARCAAVYASQTPTTALDTAAIKAAAEKDAGNLDVSKLTVTSSPNSATAPTAVTVTVTYPFSTLTRYPGFSSLTMRRTLTINVGPLLPN
jgi:Flp pilus assembly protein TadG